VVAPHLSKPNRNKRKILKRNKPHLPFNPSPQPLTKNCNKKKRFKTSQDAQVMCDELNARYAMQEIPAEVYYCNKHSAWHVGHNRAGLKRRKNGIENKP
jgi:hypothetical protein